MKPKIDLKSCLIGVLLGIAAMLVVAAESPPQSNQVERYQITGSLSYFMILDTKTGKVWTQNLPSNSNHGVPRDPDADFFTAKE
jgi:hypothetical protein